MEGLNQTSDRFVAKVIEEAAHIKEYRTPQGLSTIERRMLNGHTYRRCGGGRQIIRKKPQGANY